MGAEIETQLKTRWRSVDFFLSGIFSRFVVALCCSGCACIWICMRTGIYICWAPWNPSENC